MGDQPVLNDAGGGLPRCWAALLPRGGKSIIEQMTGSEKPTETEPQAMSSEVHYLPMTPGLFSILVVLFAGLILLIQLRIVRYAYMRLGVGPGIALLLLFGSLIGSYFNIPITILPGAPIRSGQIVEFFGMRYIVPVAVSWPGTILAVNVGGAIIPTLMSVYLLIRYQFWLRAALVTAAIAFVIHSMATPVPGIGIAVPVFAPVLTTAILAFLLSPEYAPPLAYIGGSMGTLIGADLLNLGNIGGLGAPVASIGGAGTFDGIFLTGILAVLLAGIASPSRPRPAW
jgi:uncharacterized membrane protein